MLSEYRRPFQFPPLTDGVSEGREEKNKAQERSHSSKIGLFQLAGIVIIASSFKF